VNSSVTIGGTSIALGASSSAITNDITIHGLTIGTGANDTQSTAVGSSALSTNSTGFQNVGVGYQALKANTTGVYNNAVGTFALAANTTGNYNNAMGRVALYSNTTGSSNTAIGQEALTANTTASNNTAVGYQAGYTNSTGQYNTFLGFKAGYTSNTGNDLGNTCVGSSSGYSLTTGTFNTFIGSAYGAGYYVTSGSKNTIIGGYTGNQGGLDIRTASNYIVLSDGDGNPRAYWDNTGKMYQTASTQFNNYVNVYFANGNGSTLFDLNNGGNSNPYGQSITFSAASPNNTSSYYLNCSDTTNAKLTIYSNGTVTNRTGTYNAYSDVKLKENIVDATPKLNKLMAVKVRNYNLIGDELKQIGFVAQELETVFPNLIDNIPDLDENKEPTGEITKGVKLTVLIPILVKSIQELKTIVDAQAAEIAELKAKVA